MSGIVYVHHSNSLLTFFRLSPFLLISLFDRNKDLPLITTYYHVIVVAVINIVIGIVTNIFLYSTPLVWVV